LHESEAVERRTLDELCTDGGEVRIFRILPVGTDQPTAVFRRIRQPLARVAEYVVGAVRTDSLARFHGPRSGATEIAERQHGDGQRACELETRQRRPRPVQHARQRLAAEARVRGRLVPADTCDGKRGLPTRIVAELPGSRPHAAGRIDEARDGFLEVERVAPFVDKREPLPVAAPLVAAGRDEPLERLVRDLGAVDQKLRHGDRRQRNSAYIALRVARRHNDHFRRLGALRREG
jgi:hypothetical protein